MSVLLAALLAAGLTPAPALAAVPTASADGVTTLEDQPTTVTLSATDPDGGTIDHFSIVNGTEVKGAAGAPSAPDCVSAPPACTATVTFTPAGDANGTGSFQFTATDDNAETSANATATITITPVNDTPVAVDDPGTACGNGGFGASFPIVEDYGEFTQPASGVCGLADNDTDVDGDTLTYELVTGPSHGSATVIPDGGWAYTADANFSTPSGSWPSDSFTYRAFDGTAYSAPATMRFWIAPVNDAPTFTAGTSPVTVAEDSGPYSAVWATNVSPGAPYEDTQSVTFQVAVPAPDQALFATQPAIAPNGTLTFRPAANAIGLTTVTVTAHDDGGLESYSGVTVNPRDTSDPVQLQIAVTPANDNPVAVDDAVNVAEDSSSTVVGVLVNDTMGPDTGETLSVSAITQPAHGTSTLIGGVVRYTPTANYYGPDSFTYTLSDGLGGTDTGAVSVTVTAVNDVPSFTKGANQTVAEDPGAQTVTGWATAISAGPANESGQALTFEVTGNTNVALFSVGPAVAANGTLTYTPAANANGSATITLRLKDDGGTANGGVDTSASQTFTITVTAVNDNPTAGDDSLTVAEDSGTTSHIETLALLNDSGAPDGPETLAVTSVGPASHGTSNLHPVQGIRYTPSANYNGTDAFTYTISDGNGGTATATINVTITPVNDNPVAVADTVSVAEDSVDNTISVLANDTMGPDTGETLSVSAVGVAAHGTTSLVGGVVHYVPAANYSGADTFTYTLSDGLGGTATGTVNVTVTPVNDNPTAADDGVTVLEDSGSTSIAALVNDSIAPDTGETLTVTAVTQPAHGTATFTASNVSYAPAANYNGSDSFTYTISDGNGGTDTGTVNVTITPVNDAPSFTKGANQSVLEEAGAQTVAGWATNLSAGPADEVGQTLTFTVTNDNSGLFSVQPAVAANGTLTYTPATNQYGTATVSVRINDNGGTLNGGLNQSTIQTFTITVTGVNDAPSFTKGANQTDLEDAGAQAVLGWATAITAGPGESTQAVTFEITSNTNAALFSIQPAVAANGTLTYTPAANANGSATITLRLKDDGGTANGGVDTSASQTFTITVTQVNDAPSFTKGADQVVLEDAGFQAIAGWPSDVSAGPADESGQTVSFIAANDNNGLFSVQPAVAANGTLSYSPAANANGVATVTIYALDTGGTANGGVNQSPPQSFTIAVTAVNDIPSFTRGADQTDLEDAGLQTVAGWVTAISRGAANEGSQVLTFEITSNSNPSLFSVAPAVSATGTLTYTPAANANGAATIGIRAKDDGGTANGGQDTSATQTFTITVTAVNDAPSFTKGADPTVLEDTGAQTVVGWATAISAGPADESGQTVTFTVTNTNNGLFSAQPALAANGTLTYTPAANQFGSATVSVFASDTGGTANGGVSTSAIQAFTITVTAVNDAPSFSKGADQVDLEDAGAQAVTGWASAISRGPANEAAQTLTFVVTGNDNPSLFSVPPSVAANGTLSYTPAANANGTAAIGIRLTDNGGTANGGSDTSATQTFHITVTAVNDAPSFTKGADGGLLEDAGPQTVVGWATALSAGPADEGGQALSFETMSNSNPSLFAVAPSVAANGTLTYTPADDANGSATIGVRITDSGGTASGGVNASASQSFTVTITAVNDAPSFTQGTDASAPEDAGPQVFTGWASAIAAGPGDEVGQSLTFEITSNDTPTLFDVQPAVDATTGTLTFDPKLNEAGTATVGIRLVDGGGTDNGGVDTSPTATFTITIEGVNDPPNAQTDAVTVRLAGPTAVNVLANDLGGPLDERGDPVTITSVKEGSRGIVTITGGGTGLTYDSIGCSTGTDTFTYTVSDGGGLTDTATVFVTIASPASYPVADGPRPLFVTNSTIGSTVPVKLAWCGLTSGTTIKAYRLYQSVNGGGFTSQISSTTATSSTRNLSISPTAYQFRARVTDNKGRIAYGTGPQFRVGRTQESNTAIVYTTGWKTASSGSFSGGAARYTSSAGKSATFTYTGRSFGIVGTKGTTRGSFHVYVDGVRVTSTAVSAKASSTLYRRVLYTRSLAYGLHTVRIVAVGNGRIDLDAIVTIAGG